MVERIALSPHFNRSARLRDLLVYLSDRVLDDEVSEIHEQEVGHKVFGRPLDYDSAADNIVRVHASMLRKRLDQYFSSEGAAENIVIEIPKGNYAPVFRERVKPVAEPPAEQPVRLEPLPVLEKPQTRHALTLAIVTACLFASTTIFLLFRHPAAPIATPDSPTVRLFWSQLFDNSHPTDLVIDDAAVGMYQELTNRPLSLSEYYDRSYLRDIPAVASAAGLAPETAASLILRRQSSYSDTSFLWRMEQLAGSRRMNLRFARDYSFRDLKADSAILLGNDRSNPWVQSFQSKLGVRWQFDKNKAIYYPADTFQSSHTFDAGPAGENHEGYFSIAMLPNLGGTGNVLLVAATGGSAISAAADFLSTERTMAQLRAKLPAAKGGAFPAFEALVKAKGRNSQPRDSEIVVCRPASK
ncbi:MAG TPA: hypothetical protein VN736_12570 [Candidatus Limnocylindrales bacterium]|nr:hypothetical protein [Candidatus Limnocylindrales bacterium]